MVTASQQHMHGSGRMPPAPPGKDELRRDRITLFVVLAIFLGGIALLIGLVSTGILPTDVGVDPIIMP